MAETLAKMSGQRSEVLVLLAAMWAWNGLGCGSEVIQAPCWVLKQPSHERSWGLLSVETHTRNRTAPASAEAVSDKVVWVWCWLRIAQWMRASLKLLWSSF